MRSILTPEQAQAFDKGMAGALVKSTRPEPRDVRGHHRGARGARRSRGLRRADDRDQGGPAHRLMYAYRRRRRGLRPAAGNLRRRWLAIRRYDATRLCDLAARHSGQQVPGLGPQTDRAAHRARGHGPGCARGHGGRRTPPRTSSSGWIAGHEQGDVTFVPGPAGAGDEEALRRDRRDPEDHAQGGRDHIARARQKLAAILRGRRRDRACSALSRGSAGGCLAVPRIV